jgi:hypothetical protein
MIRQRRRFPSKPRRAGLGARGSRRSLLVVCVLAIALMASAASASALNLTGNWVGYYKCEAGYCAGEKFEGTTTLVQAVGSDAVTGHNGSEQISGTLTGRTFTFTTTDGGEESFTEVTIAAGGNSWSGNSHATSGISGTVFAQREPATAELSEAEELEAKEKSKRASATTVNCYVPLLAAYAAWECTATVADASGSAAPAVPTGSVVFSVNAGFRGGFVGPHECVLKPSKSGPTAFCTVLFVPAVEVAVGAPAPITASYQGNAEFRVSSSSASSSIVHEELGELIDEDEAGEEGPGCGATASRVDGLMRSPFRRAVTAAATPGHLVVTVGDEKRAEKQRPLGRAAAGRRAIALLHASRAGRRTGVRLYGLAKPVAAGSTITEATFGLKRAIVKPLKLRERAWMFWENLQPLARYEHASVVLLISARGGRVLARAPFLSYPELNGKPAAFTASHSRKLLVYARNAEKHHKRRLTKGQLAALVLASEGARNAVRSAGKAHKADVSHSTLITLVDHVGGGTGETFENEQSAVSYTFARHGVSTEDVLTVNALSAAVQGAATDGKTNITIYLDGHGASAEGGAAIPTIGLGHNMGYVNSDDLTAIVRAHPEVQFNFIIDSCYSGRFVDPLKAESNVGVVMTSSTGTQKSSSPLQLEYDTGPTTEDGGRGLVIKNGPSEGYGGLVVGSGTGAAKKPPVELETPDGEGLVVGADESHEGISPFTTGVVAAVNQAFIGKGSSADLTEILAEARTLEPSYDLAAINGSTTPSPEPTPSAPSTCPAPLPSETPSGGWFTGSE